MPALKYAHGVPVLVERELRLLRQGHRVDDEVRPPIRPQERDPTMAARAGRRRNRQRHQQEAAQRTRSAWGTDPSPNAPPWAGLVAATSGQPRGLRLSPASSCGNPRRVGTLTRGREPRAWHDLELPLCDVLAAARAHHVALDAPAAVAVEREAGRALGARVVAVAPLHELVQRGGELAALPREDVGAVLAVLEDVLGHEVCEALGEDIAGDPQRRWKSEKRETPRKASRTISRLQRSPTASSVRAIEQTWAG